MIAERTRRTGTEQAIVFSMALLRPSKSIWGNGDGRMGRRNYATANAKVKTGKGGLNTAWARGSLIANAS